MNLNMNKYQRVTVGVAAIFIIIVQLFKFGEDGVEGFGWVIAFAIATGLLFLAFSGIADKKVQQTRFARDQQAEQLKTDKVIVDLLFESVFKNAQDYYQYIKLKQLYHLNGSLSMILKPDVYSWFVGYAVLYVLFLTSEKYRDKAQQLHVVRNLVIREAIATSAKAWEDIETKILRDVNNTTSPQLTDRPSIASQVSAQEKKIYEDHVKSLEDACKEAIKNITVNRSVYPYVSIYRVIGPVFGGINDMSEQQIAERFNPVFCDLLKKTSNVLKAL